MANYRTPEFKNLVSGFGSNIQKLVRREYLEYRKNPQSVGFEHRGYMKQNGIKRVIYKANVTGAYRAVAYKKGNDFIWWWFGTHQDYDRLLKHFTK